MRRPFFRLRGSALETPSDEIPKGILIITISERLARFYVRKASQRACRIAKGS